jgi:phosphatidylglycerol---prolipoprotein diacylglyceryl transferase
MVPSITIGLDPLIGKIGSLEIGWHAILMFVGIIVAVLLTVRLATKANIPAESVYISALWIVLFGLIGARLIHVLDNRDFYSKHPSEILAFWQGGLAWYGGLLGGILGGAVSARINKIPLGRFADIVAPGVILGLSIGRIGCTLNGDASGTPTSLPWGFVYTNPNSFAPLWVATHPYPVYEIIWDLMVFGLLWRLKDRIKPAGSLFLVMIAAYSFGRFFLSFFKDEVSVLGPLHQSHIISLVLFTMAVALLIVRKVHLATPEPRKESAEKPAVVSRSEQNQGY